MLQRSTGLRLTRRGRLTVTLTVATVLVSLVAVVLVLTRTPVGNVVGLGDRPPCTLVTSRESVEWTSEESMTATTVAGVGTRIGATINGVAAAVNRALRRQPDDVAMGPDAAREVYRVLPDVATPSARSVRVAQVLLGQAEGALSCTVPLVDGDLAAQEPGELGLTPRADLVRTEMRAVFGKQVLGGFEPRGVSDGHIDGSAHYEGRAIDVFFRPVTEDNQRRGWQQALWAVAHAERLDVATVIFDRRIWTATRSVQGWRDYRHPSGDDDNPVLMHEDHVHVDVAEGG